MFGCRIRGRLDDEDVLAAHVLVNLDKDFHVGEPAHAGLGERNGQIRRNGFRQRTVGVTRQNFHNCALWMPDRGEKSGRTIAAGAPPVNREHLRNIRTLAVWRSEARRVGKAWVSTGRSRWWAYH